VNGICTLSAAFCILEGFDAYPRAKPLGMHKTALRVHIRYTLEAMVQLTCTIVQSNCQLCIHSFEKNTTVTIELSCKLGCMDYPGFSVHEI